MLKQGNNFYLEDKDGIQYPVSKDAMEFHCLTASDIGTVILFKPDRGGNAIEESFGITGRKIHTKQELASNELLIRQRNGI